MAWWMFGPAGLAIGGYGALVGASGGVLIMPLLLIAQPGADTAQVTGTAQLVAFCSSLSGTLAYWRTGRIDLRSGLWYAAAGVPAASLGSWLTQFLPRDGFDRLFGLFLLLTAALMWRQRRTARDTPAAADEALTQASREAPAPAVGRPLLAGMVLTAGISFVSALLGIGGGVLQAPAMAGLLGFPVHVATATSGLIVALRTLAGTVTHFASGTLGGAWLTAAWLTAGVVVGAQLGARASGRLPERGLLWALAVGLAALGLWLLATG